MITLYHGPKSCSLAVKAVLEIIGVNYDTKIVNLMEGEQFSEQYLKINPLGKVPAIDLDGKVVTEGGAILSLLSELFPSSNLMPSIGSEERSEALRWLFTMYNTVNPIYSRIFMAERYADNAASVKEKAEEELHKVFSLIDQRLGATPFLAGQAPSLPDYYLLVAIHWEFCLNKRLTSSYANVMTFKSRMIDIPKVHKVFTEEYGA